VTGDEPRARIPLANPRHKSPRTNPPPQSAILTHQSPPTNPSNPQPPIPNPQLRSSTVPVAVASHSFPKHPFLRRELIARYPDAVFNETRQPLRGDDLVRFLRGHDKAITGLEVLDDRLFSAVPELRVVSKYGVGLDMIDLDAARRHGVSVRWTPGVNRQSVAELTIAFMIALCRRIVPLATDLRGGRWGSGGGRQLSSATVGVIGCGHVGRTVARLCAAFGATVLAHDIVNDEDFYRTSGVRAVPLAALLGESDIVTLHVPLDDSTRNMIDARALAMMKPTAVLINAARGGIVDEIALTAALAEGRLAGATADVFAVEPPATLELLRLPNFIGTPHIGGSTEEAVLAMGRAAISGLELEHGSLDLTSNS
jgi:phosphoglycerate dehydrogenase-like enzyme